MCNSCNTLCGWINGVCGLGKYATVSHDDLVGSEDEDEKDDMKRNLDILEDDEQSCSDIASPTPARREDPKHHTPAIPNENLPEISIDKVTQEVGGVDEEIQADDNIPDDTTDLPVVPPSIEEVEEGKSPEIDENITPNSLHEEVVESSEPAKQNQPSQKSSRFRLPSLDGDDVQLFSDLISQSRAKKVGKGGTISSLTAADNAVASPIPLSPTKPRRALEYLDKNSPCSPERQISARTDKKNAIKNASPVKRPILSLTPPKKPDFEQEPSKVVGKQLRSRLRSNRGDGSTDQTMTKKQVPKVPDQIPVRRAKGTEFVFLKRSESQELALTTKANTKRNKGRARPADLVLEDLKNGVISDNQDSSNKRPKPRSSDNRKRVTWNKNLEEYCDGVEFEAQGYSERTARLQERREKRMRKQTESEPSDNEQETEKPKAKARKEPAKLPAVPKAKPGPKPGSTPGARKMRKLVGTKHKDVVPDDSATPPVTRLRVSIKSSSAFPGTPIRRKASASKGGEGEGESLFSVPFGEETRRTRRSGGRMLGMGLGLGGGDGRAKKPTGLPCPTSRQRGV